MNRSRGFPFPYTSLFTCQQAVGIAKQHGDAHVEAGSQQRGILARLY